MKLTPEQIKKLNEDAEFYGREADRFEKMMQDTNKYLRENCPHLNLEPPNKYFIEDSLRWCKDCGAMVKVNNGVAI